MRGDYCGIGNILAAKSLPFGFHTATGFATLVRRFGLMNVEQRDSKAELSKADRCPLYFALKRIGVRFSVDGEKECTPPCWCLGWMTKGM